jgi:hydrogenase maturation protease
MGNTLLSDDGIGIIIKRYLEQRLYDAGSIDFVETSWGGFRIIDILTGYDYAVIVDSIKTAGKPEGYIHHLKTNDFLPTLRLTSMISISQLHCNWQRLQCQNSVDIDIFQVEVEDNYTISEHINPRLWKSIKMLTLLKHLKISLIL